jgi:hypothetical protein
MSPCNHSLEVTSSVTIAWIRLYSLNQICETFCREISYFHEFAYSVICDPTASLETVAVGSFQSICSPFFSA